MADRILENRFEPDLGGLSITAGPFKFGQRLALRQFHLGHGERLREPQSRRSDLERRRKMTEQFVGDAGVIEQHQPVDRSFVVLQIQTSPDLLERDLGLFKQQSGTGQLEAHGALHRNVPNRTGQQQGLLERRLRLHSIRFERRQLRHRQQHAGLTDHVTDGTKGLQRLGVVCLDLIEILELYGTGGHRSVQVAAQQGCWGKLETALQDRVCLIGPSESQQRIADLKPNLSGGVRPQMPVQHRKDPPERSLEIAPVKLEFGLRQFGTHAQVQVGQARPIGGAGQGEHLRDRLRPFVPVMHGAAEFRTAPMHLEGFTAGQMLNGAGITAQRIRVREDRFGGTGRLEPPTCGPLRFEGAFELIGDAFRRGVQALEALRDAPMQQPGAFRVQRIRQRPADQVVTETMAPRLTTDQARSDGLLERLQAREFIQGGRAAQFLERKTFTAQTGRLEDAFDLCAKVIDATQHGLTDAAGHGQFGVIFGGLVVPGLPRLTHVQLARFAQTAQRLEHEQRVSGGYGVQAVGEAFTLVRTGERPHQRQQLRL